MEKNIQRNHNFPSFLIQHRSPVNGNSITAARVFRVASVRVCRFNGKRFEFSYFSSAGVTPLEILFSHVITQFVVMCGQTALVLIFMILVFGVECKGDISLVIALTILQGLCGMCFGKCGNTSRRISFWQNAAV